MTESINLLIPELVPLANRGEEAIVRGVADVLYPNGNCEIHLFDDVENYRFEDGIHVYPVEWFISPWLKREFGLGASWEKTRDSLFSLIRNVLHKVWPRWVKRRCRALRRTAAQMRALAEGGHPSSNKERSLVRLLNCDFVIAGHDGALDERVSQVIDVMRELGKEFGVFGVEFPTKFKSWAIADVQYQILRHSRFFHCRTAASNVVAKQYFPKIDSDVLADPAFGMKAASDEAVDKIIVEKSLTEIFRKPVVMCTSCEPTPISRHCFESIRGPGAKLAAHRELYANLIRYVVAEYDVNVLFLPHAIGPGSALDDRIIAHDILRRASVPSGRAVVLESLHSARELKGLIKRGEILIAERIHSMIGAVGVSTPFLCLGSNTDRRIHGIICEMLGMTENVYFLNSPKASELQDKFDSVWSRRDIIRKELAEVYEDLASNLETEARAMRMTIEGSLV